jgi:hypothetical protein
MARGEIISGPSAEEGPHGPVSRGEAHYRPEIRVLKGHSFNPASGEWVDNPNKCA